MPTQHLATPPREERVAVSHVLGYCLPSRYAGLEAIMVRVYRQPDERLSTQRPERLTRTFNYTRRRFAATCFSH